jgi:hypothetical protein
MPVGKVDRSKLGEQIAKDEADRTKGNTFFQPDDGKNNVRILPPGPSSDVVFVKTATHWGVGPNRENFNCPCAADKEADCFLCQTVYKLSKSKDEDENALADSLRAKKSWLYNIIDIDDLDAGIQVAAFGVTIHNDILVYLKDADDEYGDITDLEDGTTLVITKTGKGMNTKYDTRARRNRSALPDVILTLLETEDPIDLSTVRPIAPNDKQKAAFEGGSAEEDDEEEDEPVRKTKGKAKPAPVVVDDDDDDEDEAPAPKSKGKSKPVVVEDDDDDDDDEAPAPRRSFGEKLRTNRAK